MPNLVRRRSTATGSALAMGYITYALLRQLIDFYQGNLRWKPSDENAMEE